MENRPSLWNLNHWLVSSILEGFTDEDFRKRFEGHNPAIWLLGHIVTTRKHLCQDLGMDPGFNEGDERFGMGTDPADLPDDVDALELAEEFSRVHEILISHLGKMSDADLAAESPNEFPMMPKTMAGTLDFLCWHENYHVGQLASVRKMLGKGSWMGQK